MKMIEHWVLRIADSDLTWVGLGWLRPAKHQSLHLGYILFSSFLLGLPGIFAGAGFIYLWLRSVSLEVWLALFVFAMLVEVPLHLVFAHYWNRRAAELARVGGSGGHVEATEARQ